MKKRQKGKGKGKGKEREREREFFTPPPPITSLDNVKTVDKTMPDYHFE